ncbi:MAG: septum formation initiator family protein [Actinomycetes bacterium]|jgi:cell division protein FtsB
MNFAPKDVIAARPSLTGRAIVLVGVIGVLAVTLVVPIRELVHQRSQLNALREANAQAQARVDDLSLQEERLKDPVFVISLVRERLHYVLPGEVGYVVLDPSEAPAPATIKAGKTKPAWFATLWTSVQKADQAGVVPEVLAPLIIRPNAPR